MKPHAHTRMLTHSNLQTHTYTYHGKEDTESTWDLERRREIKEGEKVNWHQRNVLKTRHCKLLPCTVAFAVRMCIWTLSGWKQHPFVITLYLLTAFEGHRELHLQLEPQLRNAEHTGKMKRWEDTSHPPEDHRGESPVELACDSAFSQWILTKPYRILGESWDLNNTFSAPPAAAKAWCFLLWMFGSNQSLPDTLSLQLLTCLYLPPKPPRAILSSSPTAFFPTVTHPTDCLFTGWWSLWTHFFIYSLKRFTITCFFFFFLTALTAFCVSCPPLFTRQTLPLTPALTPDAGAGRGTACSEHCGVLRTAWSNVDEAWGSPVGESGV